jgi:hypothetical protein
VITIGPGTFAGGITVTASVSLVGAGAGKTIINGGGPVVTIGTFQGTSQPTVSIAGVTITGGNSTLVLSPANAEGGGLAVLPSADGSAGATVTVTDSIITGNRAQPSGSTSCGPGCTFSVAIGGGIVNYGAMTLTGTTVSNNIAIGATLPPSDSRPVAAGGGIGSGFFASLTLHDSTVTGNTASIGSTDTLGFREQGGGIDSGPLSIDGSTIRNNRIIGTDTNPNADGLGIGGGIHLSASATIQRSQITGNSVTLTGPAQFVGAGAGGIDDDGALVLSNSTVSNNRASLNYTSSAPAPNIGADAGAMEVDGDVSIANTTFAGNSASASVPIASIPGPPGGSGGALFLASPDPVSITNSTFTGNSAHNDVPSGNAGVAGGAIFSFSTVTMTNDVIAGNTASASSGPGEVGTGGGGIVNGGGLTLSHSTVTKNTGNATGTGGLDQGGGVWNSDLGNGPPVLTLAYSTITHNTLTATSGVTAQVVVSTALLR